MDEMIKTLLERPPGQWPAGVRRAVSESPPESVDAKVLAAIRAMPEPSGFQIVRYRFHFAAAATVVLAFLAFLWFPNTGADLRMQHSGAAILEREGKVIALDTVRSEDILTTGPRASVVLTQDARVFRLLADSRIKLKNTSPLRIELVEGGLLLDSGGQHDFVVLWQGAEFRPLGTQAKFEVHGDRLEISVVSGAFSLQKYSTTETIQANQTIRIFRDAITRSNLSSAELQAIERELVALKDVSREDMSSLESIKRFYGSIQSVRMRDGKTMVGFYFVRNGQPFLHTIDGVIPLLSKQIEEVRPVQ
ncbi:MAG: FecR domain-containing protein [Leptospirales bacterium]|nr:FecR domain-containing protein [Leptospirales bacterium]